MIEELKADRNVLRPTKEELKKEFEKYLKDSADYYDPREPFTDRKLLQLWLDCAEPREKRIAELNKKLSQAEADYDKMFWQKNEIISDLQEQIEKAKELLKQAQGYIENLDDELYDEIQQFLNSEVDK